MEGEGGGRGAAAVGRGGAGGAGGSREDGTAGVMAGSFLSSAAVASAPASEVIPSVRATAEAGAIAEGGEDVGIDEDSTEWLLQEARNLRRGSGREGVVDMFREAAAGTGAAAAAAQEEIAQIYMEGSLGVERDFGLALQHFNMSAQAGNAQAHHYMAFAYSSGLMSPSSIPRPDESKALLHEYFAALGGDAMAQMGLGYRHLMGYGVAKSCESALPFYEMAANAAVESRLVNGVLPRAEPFRLSEMSMLGRRHHADSDKEVFRYFELSARNGEVDALRTLATFHFHGARSASQDLSKAAEYFEKAALTGDKASMSSLGHMCLHGIGVDRDLSKAWDYFLSSAQEQHSLNGLGYIHMHGGAEINVPRDLRQAVQYFEEAIKIPPLLAEASFHLGELYMVGTEAERRRREQREQEEEQEKQRLERDEHDRAMAGGRVGGAAAAQAQAQAQAAEAAVGDTAAAEREGQGGGGNGSVGRSGKVRDRRVKRGRDNGGGEETPYVLRRADRQGDGHTGTHTGNQQEGGRGGGIGGQTEPKRSSSGSSSGRSSSSSSSSGSSNSGSNGDGSKSRKRSAGMGGKVVERNPKMALQYFTKAAQHGHIEASLKLAQMYRDGVGMPKAACHDVVNLFKSVAERGPWVATLNSAYRRYQEGDMDGALMQYAQVAEVGYELAQSNAAWLLERGHCLGMDAESCQKRALRMYSHSAAQGRAESSLKVGDFFYKGRAGLEVDHPKAKHHYYKAKEGGYAQAMFNLGWMYQTGTGVRRDLHLAKRFYDEAAETSVEAMVPVRLALYGMYIQDAWETYVPETWREKLSELRVLLPGRPGPGAHRRQQQGQEEEHQSSVLLGAVRAGQGSEGWKKAKWVAKEVAAFDTVLLVGLLAVLAYVLKVRRRRTTNRWRTNSPADHAEEGGEGVE